MSQVTVESTIAGALTQGCFHHRSMWTLFPGNEPTLSVNRRTSRALSSLQKGNCGQGVWAEDLGQSPMELPSLNSFGPGGEGTRCSGK